MSLICNGIQAGCSTLLNIYASYSHSSNSIIYHFPNENERMATGTGIIFNFLLQHKYSYTKRKY